MSKIDTNVLHDGQLAVATVDQSGTITKKSAINTNILVQTEDGEQLCVATYPLNGGGGGGYVLPPATAETLGGVKVGQNLTVEADGTLNATGGGGNGADTSLSNITNDGKQVITEMAAPSSVYEVLTPANNATYTAPADGWFYLYGITTSDFNDAYLYNGGSGINRMNSIRVAATTVQSADKIIGISYPAKAGEVVGLEYTNIIFTDRDYNNIGLRFYYLEGNKSEYTPS